MNTFLLSELRLAQNAAAIAALHLTAEVNLLAQHNEVMRISSLAARREANQLFDQICEKLNAHLIATPSDALTAFVCATNAHIENYKISLATHPRQKKKPQTKEQK